MDSQLDFSQKRKNLFDSLDNAEKSLVGSNLRLPQSAVVKVQDFTVQNKNKKQKPEVRLFSKKESIFKRPELPITKCLPTRRVPDYQRNPHKWKKYNLEGIDISDNANSSAAFAFLQEMDKRRESNGAELDLVELPSKIEFKKSVKLQKELRQEESDESTSKTRVLGTKIVMPEYCIGKKTTNKKRDNPSVVEKPKNKKNELKLDHLLEEEEDE